MYVVDDPDGAVDGEYLKYDEEVSTYESLEFARGMMKRIVVENLDTNYRHQFALCETFDWLSEYVRLVIVANSREKIRKLEYTEIAPIFHRACSIGATEFASSVALELVSEMILPQDDAMSMAMTSITVGLGVETLALLSIGKPNSRCLGYISAKAMMEDRRDIEETLVSRVRLRFSKITDFIMEYVEQSIIARRFDLVERMISKFPEHVQCTLENAFRSACSSGYLEGIDSVIQKKRFMNVSNVVLDSIGEAFLKSPIDAFSRALSMVDSKTVKMMTSILLINMDDACRKGPELNIFAAILAAHSWMLSKRYRNETRVAEMRNILEEHGTRPEVIRALERKDEDDLVEEGGIVEFDVPEEGFGFACEHGRISLAHILSKLRPFSDLVHPPRNSSAHEVMKGIAKSMTYYTDATMWFLNSFCPDDLEVASATIVSAVNRSDIRTAIEIIDNFYDRGLVMSTSLLNTLFYVCHLQNNMPLLKTMKRYAENTLFRDDAKALNELRGSKNHLTEFFVYELGDGKYDFASEIAIIYRIAFGHLATMSLSEEILQGLFYSLCRHRYSDCTVLATSILRDEFGNDVNRFVRQK